MPGQSVRIAFVFPGQGSQQPGMGRALAEQEPLAARVFQEADKILGYPQSAICWGDPTDKLNQTTYTQPALLTHSVAVLRALRKRRPEIQPVYMAGHSLGEISVLVATGSLSFPQALRLVKERGEAMRQAGARNPGGMVAVLGLQTAVVEECCQRAAQQSGQYVGIANDNCPGQVVISGHDKALLRATEILRQAGARRLVRLPVSIASHSPLMAAAQKRFNLALAATPLRKPAIPILGNVSAAPLRSAAEVRADLGAQLTARVRWTETIRAMLALGVNAFIELGSGNVLCGLIRRISPQSPCWALDHPDSFHALGQ